MGVPYTIFLAVISNILASLHMQLVLDVWNCSHRPPPHKPVGFANFMVNVTEHGQKAPLKSMPTHFPSTFHPHSVAGRWSASHQGICGPVISRRNFLPGLCPACGYYPSNLPPQNAPKWLTK